MNAATKQQTRKISALAWVWLSIVVLYGLFFSWYTSWGGPLQDEEIANYLELMRQQSDDRSAEELANIERFMQEDTGDDFVMVNLLDLYDTPIPVEGADKGETSSELLDRYMAYMYPALFSRACHPVLFGTAANQAMDLVNAPGMSEWSTGAAMRYRSRRDLFDIVLNEEFAGSHEFKVAALRKTIAFPIDPWFHFGDPRLLLALILSVLGLSFSWWYSARRSD